MLDVSTLLCVYSAVLVAISFTIDKVALGTFDPFTWTYLMYAVPLLFLLPQTRKTVAEFSPLEIKVKAAFFGVILLQSLFYIAFTYVLAFKPLAFVYPLSQLASLVVFIGAFILGEKSSLRYRIPGYAITLLGGALLFFFG